METAGTLSLFAPFDLSKMDEEKRIVYGYATVEEPDRQGDIVDYDASVRAFQRWAGNIREQHDPRRVIGKAVIVEPDPVKRGIWLGAYISRSADGENALQKIKEGILTGWSIKGPVYRRGTTLVKTDAGEKTFNRINDYDIEETSAVDVPAGPSAVIQMVKSVGGVCIATDVLGSETEEAALVVDPPAAPDAVSPDSASDGGVTVAAESVPEPVTVSPAVQMMSPDAIAAAIRKRHEQLEARTSGAHVAGAVRDANHLPEMIAAQENIAKAATAPPDATPVERPPVVAVQPAIAREPQRGNWDRFVRQAAQMAPAGSPIRQQLAEKAATVTAEDAPPITRSSSASPAATATTLPVSALATADLITQTTLSVLRTLEKRDVSDEERDKLADKDQALPDGSFPIKTIGDLDNAIHAYGRAKDPAKTKALIVRRAKELGATDHLPDDWQVKKQYPTDGLAAGSQPPNGGTVLSGDARPGATSSTGYASTPDGQAVNADIGNPAGGDVPNGTDSAPAAVRGTPEEDDSDGETNPDGTPKKKGKPSDYGVTGSATPSNIGGTLSVAGTMKAATTPREKLAVALVAKCGGADLYGGIGKPDIRNATAILNGLNDLLGSETEEWTGDDDDTAQLDMLRAASRLVLGFLQREFSEYYGDPNQAAVQKGAVDVGAAGGIGESQADTHGTGSTVNPGDPESAPGNQRLIAGVGTAWQTMHDFAVSQGAECAHVPANGGGVGQTQKSKRAVGLADQEIDDVNGEQIVKAVAATVGTVLDTRIAEVSKKFDTESSKVAQSLSALEERLAKVEKQPAAVRVPFASGAVAPQVVEKVLGSPPGSTGAAGQSDEDVIDTLMKAADQITDPYAREAVHGAAALTEVKGIFRRGVRR